MEIEVLKTGCTNSECGCPEEELLIGGVYVNIHLEPDGSGDAFFDGGEWDTDEVFEAATMEELRQKAHDWVAALPPAE